MSFAFCQAFSSEADMAVKVMLPERVYLASLFNLRSSAANRKRPSIALQASGAAEQDSSRAARLRSAILYRSVQESSHQVDHVGAARLGRALAPGDQIHLRCPVSTNRARKQMEHIVVVAGERFRAAI